jgi:ketosteroid isomerase-like protein
MSKQAVKNEVWEVIQAMNRLWTTENRPDKLAEYFHERMMAITPTDRLRREGREACLAGWKAFTDNAKIHYWKEIDPLIEVYGEGRFAVATYYFEMSVETGGQTFKLEGRDMFSLLKEDGKWRVVSDQFSPYPQR